MKNSRVLALAVGLGLTAAIVVGVVAASTAGNTVPETRAGAGQGEVTGYEVSSVHYELSQDDPSRVNSITFGVDTAPPPNSTVRVKGSEDADTWYDCEFTGTTVTCNTSSPALALDDVTSLVVVAAQ